MLDPPVLQAVSAEVVRALQALVIWDFENEQAHRARDGLNEWISTLFLVNDLIAGDPERFG